MVAISLRLGKFSVKLQGIFSGIFKSYFHIILICIQNLARTNKIVADEYNKLE